MPNTLALTERVLVEMKQRASLPNQLLEERANLVRCFAELIETIPAGARIIGGRADHGRAAMQIRMEVFQPHRHVPPPIRCEGQVMTIACGRCIHHRHGVTHASKLRRDLALQAFHVDLAIAHHGDAFHIAGETSGFDVLSDCTLRERDRSRDEEDKTDGDFAE